MLLARSSDYWSSRPTLRLRRKPLPLQNFGVSAWIWPSILILIGALDVKNRSDAPRSTISFEIGENVRVTDGPFASFNGIVEELDFEKHRVKVAVSIFGRATPVELGFEEVELVK